MMLPPLPPAPSRVEAPSPLPPPKRGEAFDQFLEQSRAAATQQFRPGSHRASRDAQPPEPAATASRKAEPRDAKRSAKQQPERAERTAPERRAEPARAERADLKSSEAQAEEAQTPVEDAEPEVEAAQPDTDPQGRHRDGSEAQAQQPQAVTPRTLPETPAESDDTVEGVRSGDAADADAPIATAAKTGFNADASDADDPSTAAQRAAKPAAGKADGGADLLKLLQPVGAETAAKPRGEAQSAPSNNAAPAAQSPVAEQDPNVARVARGLQNAVSQNGGSVSLRLTPAEMGVVRIQMEVRDGVATVRLQAEQESARTLLSHQIHSLRHALESQGLTVDRLEVQSPPQQSGAQQQGFGQERQAEGATDDGRSRGFFRREDRERDDRPDRQSDQPESFESLVNAVA